MVKYGPITSCQSCGGKDLESIIFLGNLPPCNVLREIGQPADAQQHFPAELLYCPMCHLVQIGYAADPSLIFPPTYPYTSGTTRILRENFADLYAKTAKMLDLKSYDLVVDIGSNDGTLLSNFYEGGHLVVGIEPTLQAKRAEEQGIPTIMKFMGKEAVDEVLRDYGKAKVVTAANVFAHMHGIHDVISEIERVLDDDGVFISESHYLGGLLQNLQYDTIYHEHLRYYSYVALQNLLAVHGFIIFHVDRIPTHGGSVRCYASRSKKWDIDETVTKIFGEEIEAGLTSPVRLAKDGWIKKFREGVRRSKIGLYHMIESTQAMAEGLVGIGAPSRASTLVTYTGLDDGILSSVMEVKGSQKIGKYMPGTQIPILEESELYRTQPPWALLLSWHIADEMKSNLRKKGFRGGFITPLPEVRVEGPSLH